jgi:hypothetical protein
LLLLASFPWTGISIAISSRGRNPSGGWSRSAFAAELDAGRLCVVDFAVPMKHTIHLRTSRGAYPLPALKQVTDVIRQAFADIRARRAAPTQG